MDERHGQRTAANEQSYVERIHTASPEGRTEVELHALAAHGGLTKGKDVDATWPCVETAQKFGPSA
jgi:hypothetical protein